MPIRRFFDEMRGFIEGLWSCESSPSDAFCLRPPKSRPPRSHARARIHTHTHSAFGSLTHTRLENMGANDSKQKFPGAEPVASGQMPAPAGNADEGMWDWRAGRPPSLAATPNPSAHGAQAFKEMSNDSKEGSTHGGLMKRSVSFLWDWGGNRTPDANATPGNSLHGGNKFAKPGDSAHGGVSFWNWSSGRCARAEEERRRIVGPCSPLPGCPSYYLTRAPPRFLPLLASLSFSRSARPT